MTACLASGLARLGSHAQRGQLMNVGKARPKPTWPLAGWDRPEGVERVNSYGFLLAERVVSRHTRPMIWSKSKFLSVHQTLRR